MRRTSRSFYLRFKSSLPPVVKDRIYGLFHLHQYYYFQTNNDYKNSIILAGVGRSGTTWVDNIINYRNQYRVLFEPFNGSEVPLVRDYHYPQYLRPDNKDEKFLAPARVILSGRIRNPWVDMENRRLVCHRRLIKAIRANLFLKWISVNFPQIPIIFLLRHPCAVARSKIRLRWKTYIPECLAQDDLMADFLGPFKKEMGKIDTDFEKHVLLWCIENYLPLKQFRKGEMLLTFYENLCAFPEDEIKNVLSFLGQEMDERVFAAFRRPSSLARKHSAIITGENLVDGWRREVSREQIARAIEILSVFGLDKIYSADSMPNTGAALAMMPSG